MKSGIHQYIQRKNQMIQTESLLCDRTIQALYTRVRESAPAVFNLLVSSRMSSLLGFLNYDLPLKNRGFNPGRLLADLNIPPADIHGPLTALNTYRRFFERQIRYWECRPMSPNHRAIVSPADSRVIVGSLSPKSRLFIKEKFFQYSELIGKNRPAWLSAFRNGDFALFRLTPEKYHYNHVPVAGKVMDVYEINGRYHACNPGAVVRSVTPCSKNRRIVTVIDTDVDNGTRVGLVAMVEIVALMIGKIVQCYSPTAYDFPRPAAPGLFLAKGVPKSLFCPGSSTTLLMFEQNRIRLSRDLVQNTCRTDVCSRFSSGFNIPLVETELNVRETIGEAI
jgi:phosphatidylserine decarboxylase